MYEAMPLPISHSAQSLGAITYPDACCSSQMQNGIQGMANTVPSGANWTIVDSSF